MGRRTSSFLPPVIPGSLNSTVRVGSALSPGEHRQHERHDAQLQAENIHMTHTDLRARRLTPDFLANGHMSTTASAHD